MGILNFSTIKYFEYGEFGFFSFAAFVMETGYVQPINKAAVEARWRTHAAPAGAT